MNESLQVSARESEVLAALGTGLSNAQIARRMQISIRTVEGHVSSLLRKYGVADRQALAARAGNVETVARPGDVSGLSRSRTSFVGRRAEVETVRAALVRARLVTLVGPGGVGKTRLAEVVTTAVAPEYRYGAAFVDLVPVRDGRLGHAVAAVLEVAEHADGQEAEAVVSRLCRGPSLLVLDNCEHLPDAVAEFVERVLAVSPTTILATSRERLGIPGELVHPIAPLPLGSDAEELFRDRAQLASQEGTHDAATVADLCSRLDGLPLAIELAAARSASLGATGLLTGLGDYLRLLAGGRGSVVRHRSLRGVIGWSHDLLTEEEQAVFRRLSVFVGDVDLAAVAAVSAVDAATAADVLGRLVDKSLLQRRGSSWRMLDTVRAFAAERLADDPEHAEVRRRYLRWAADLATDLAGRSAPAWHAEFDAVVGDLQAALAGHEQPDAEAHRLARTLGRLTIARGYLWQAPGWFCHAARCAPDAREATRDFASAADCAQIGNEVDRAFELRLAAADRAREGGDRNLWAGALAQAVDQAGRFAIAFRDEIPFERRRALLAEAVAAGDPQDPIVAARIACAAAWTATPSAMRPDAELAAAAVAAARAAGDPVLISASLDAMSLAAINDGRIADWHRLIVDRLAVLALLDPRRPDHAVEISDARGLSSLTAVAAADLPAARTAARLISDAELSGDSVYLAASKTVPVLVLSGDLDDAVRLAEDMWMGWLRAGRPWAYGVWLTMPLAALAHGLRGDAERVAVWRARSAEVGDPQSLGWRVLDPLVTFVDARLALRLGDLGQAAELAERARRLPATSWYRALARAAVVELTVAAGLPSAAADLAAAEADSAGNDWATATVLRAAGRLRGDAVALAGSAELWRRMGARFEHETTVELFGAG
ncbi:ATP-binding protein [Pseudonocardia sp. TRM90224]|uniref:ATP-binding protein n=1 Tax=Pseudonocardia sp. TRM90224 TaxID=2812678 RepID=UPI001E3E2F53|nr:LuxR C-terminal-related transcriptional regulator [Pseudonocardia sp. TRM90224]